MWPEAPAPDDIARFQAGEPAAFEFLTLLFLHTGFKVEAVYGDYRGRPLGPQSPQIIVVGCRS